MVAVSLTQIEVSFLEGILEDAERKFKAQPWSLGVIKTLLTKFRKVIRR